MLRQRSPESTVFADVAALIEVMVNEGLTCQTNLATKEGATHSGQFIGSFAFYRELRRTRYARIPDHPAGAIAADVPPPQADLPFDVSGSSPTRWPQTTSTLDLEPAFTPSYRHDSSLREGIPLRCDAFRPCFPER